MGNKKCECGCGKETNLITKNNILRKQRKGEFYRFIHGHGGHNNREKRGIIESCGYCKKDFYVMPYEIKRKRFCSKKCYSSSMKGRKPWNKGLTKETNEIVKNVAELKIGKTHKIKDTSKMVMAQSNRPAEVNRKMKETWNKPEMKEFARQRRLKQILPVKDTKIEVKIQNFLNQLGIEFFTHQYMKIEHGYQCDILIPSMNLVIECDGDYWHGNPVVFPNPSDMQIEQINKDGIRTIELIAKGFKVLRLWEKEINNTSIQDFKIIINGLKNKNGIRNYCRNNCRYGSNWIIFPVL